MAAPASRVDTATSTRPSSETAAPPPSLTGLAAHALRSARNVVGHVLEVAALESRLATTTLAVMVAVAVAVAVLALTVWGLLVAAGVSALVEVGWDVAPSLLVAALVNLVAAVLLVVLIVRLGRRMLFTATRRVLAKLGSGS